MNIIYYSHSFKLINVLMSCARVHQHPCTGCRRVRRMCWAVQILNQRNSIRSRCCKLVWCRLNQSRRINIPHSQGNFLLLLLQIFPCAFVDDFYFVLWLLVCDIPCNHEYYTVLGLICDPSFKQVQFLDLSTCATLLCLHLITLYSNTTLSRFMIWWL
jgi:hypothetical protein